MKKQRFQLEYIDPDTREEVVQVMVFSDAAGIPAQVWAEDYAYTLADKGWNKVTPCD